MSNQSVKHIAICGAGFTGILCAFSLLAFLPEEIELTLIDTPGANETDVFYGNIIGSDFNEFLLKLGITEPDFLPETNTTFSLGTQYFNWGATKRSWTQSFHKPLPIFQGVEFHHYLTRLRKTNPEAASLEPYILSALAASKGVFAHPPEETNSLLSNLEYGYHFLPAEWRYFLSKKLKGSRLKRLSGDIENIERMRERINALVLTGDTKVEADFFIDCTGSKSKIHPDIINSQRRLKAFETFKSDEDLKSSARRISGTEHGWLSETTFQNGTQYLTIFAPDTHDKAYEKAATPVEVPIGYTHKAWQGNCLSVGHSAAILEPLTPAPVTLLLRDITRLLELIPHSQDMTVEAREYNRRFANDYEHGSIFQYAFFEDADVEHASYWASAIKEAKNPKLKEKITQFLSRGTIISYDLEPFRKEDWVQLHLGMGRAPKRYDPLANKADKKQILGTFQKMREANIALVRKMPPQQIYIKKLLEYLRENHG